MCGRYALTTPPQVLAALFKLGDKYLPAMRYNIAPTQTVPIVVQRADGSREMMQMRWGLIPSWAKDATIGNRMINARSESAAEKPAFRSAMRSRRCLVPVSGFYEWQQRDGRKQPYYIRRADGQPMALAGLWESWVDKSSGEEVNTFTILTTSANEQIASLHDRMPVIIDPKDFDHWLDPREHDSSKVVPLLRPAAGSVLEMHPVSKRVNTPKNDDATLIEPVQADDVPKVAGEGGPDKNDGGLFG